MGTFTTVGNFRDSNGNVDLNPELLDVLQTAAALSPYNVEAFSGVAGRSAFTTNHPGGHAVDIRLVDPATGQVLDNYQRGGAFQEYERFAQIARVVQQDRYPDLNDTFRWGGYFAGGPNPADLMHFDVNPRLGGAMGGGSWLGGANADYLARWGYESSNPGLGDARWLNQIEDQYRMGRPFLPPAPLGSDAPIPAPRSMIEDVRAGRPVTSDYVGSGASFDEVRGFGAPLPRRRAPIPASIDAMPPSRRQDLITVLLAGGHGNIQDATTALIPPPPNVDSVESFPSREQFGAFTLGARPFRDGSGSDPMVRPPMPTRPATSIPNDPRLDNAAGGMPASVPRQIEALRERLAALRADAGPVGSGAPTSLTPFNRPDIRPEIARPVGDGRPISLNPFTPPVLRPQQPTGSGAPISLTPFQPPAPSPPTGSPVGSGAPISLTPFSTLPPRPKTQFGGEGMPSLYPFGVTDFQGPDPELLRLMEHNNPPLPRPRPDSTSSSPVGSGAPIDITPFTTPKSPVPRAIEPAAVPKWMEKTVMVENPAYTVYMEQLANNQRMTPTGSVVTADQFRALNDPNYRPPPAPPVLRAPPKLIPQTVRVPIRAPAPLPLAPLLAPIPATQSAALLAKRQPVRPRTVASTTPLQRVQSEQTGGGGVGGTTRSMEQSTRWTTGY